MTVVTEGILGMPFELAMADQLTARQFYVTARSRIAELEAENARLRELYAREGAKAMCLSEALSRTEWPRGTRIRVEHDGFEGIVLGPYETLEGKRGQVCQLVGARVIHVYGEKWLQRVDAAKPGGGELKPW